MTTSNRLEQLIELTGNICNAFTIALYKADLNKKKLTLRHHISFSSNFNGVKNGDLLQRGIASTLSSTLPSPKYIFKFSETIYIVILINREWSKIQPFVIKLENMLNNTPLFIEGKAMQTCIELGASCFPENGKTLSQLVGASLHKTTSQFFSETTAAI